MATDKTSQKHSQTTPVVNNPLADIAGKFGGEFWLETQSEIERYRQIDKEEIEEDNLTKKEILSDLRQAWQEVKNGETIPVEQL